MKSQIFELRQKLRKPKNKINKNQAILSKNIRLKIITMLSIKIRFFLCGLIHENDTESNALIRGNCEFRFICPNWNCPQFISYKNIYERLA